MSPKAYGVDIASYQKGLDLSKVHGEGFAFAYTKATQGTNYIDPEYRTWAANPGGLHEIPYHYLTQESYPAQMAFFRSIVGPAPHECMLDFETGGPVNIAQVTAAVEAAHAEDFIDVDAYIPHWRWVEMGSPDLSHLNIRYLIASDYPTNAPGYASALYPGDGFSGWNEYGNKKPDILQFTDEAIVAGQHVDADAADANVVWDSTPTRPVTKPTSPAGWSATVKQVQQAMNRWPFSPALLVDGELGPKTKAAVIVFQHAAEIESNGIVGPITWQKLNLIYDANRPQVKLGSKGTAVKWVQTRLNEIHSYGLKVDGNFGVKTLAAVERFQATCELSSDGVVGKETNAALQL